jgi:2-polyprenyl-6-methoxyphenol hydroxylase-like FAD-dependent oxidoreductase
MTVDSTCISKDFVLKYSLDFIAIFRVNEHVTNFMEEHPIDVLVSGAGPVGLFFAILLKQHYPEVRIRVIDKAESLSKYSKAIGVAARTIEHLKALKPEYFNKFMELGLAAKCAHVRSSNKEGKEVITAKLDHMSTPFSMMLLIAQYDTEKILEMALNDLGVFVERNVQLKSQSQTGDVVQVKLEHLKEGRTEDMQCRFLITADGGKSTIRHLLNLAFQGQARSEVFFMGDVDVEAEWLDGNPQVFIGDRGILVFLPFRNKNHVRVLMNMPPDDPMFHSETTQLGVDKHDGATNLNFGIKELEERTKDRVNLPFKFSNLEWVTTFRVNERLVEKYRVGNVFLVGDAAHVHSPAGGQGMNLGMQDAVNLSWKLALVLKGLASDKLLDTYEFERRPIADAVVNSSSKLTSTMGFDPVLKFVRTRIVLPLLPWVYSLIQSPSLPEGIATLNIRYGHSQITAMGPNGMRSPTIGELIGSSCKMTPLDLYFSTSKHTLLCFLENEVMLENFTQNVKSLRNSLKSQISFEIIKSPNSTNAAEDTDWYRIWEDKDGLISKALAVKADPHYVLVRPDGYIGCQVAQLADIETHLSQYLSV